MKIIEITEDHILFEGGHEITYHHDPDCCEDNYAAFKEIDDLAKCYDFTHPVQFKRYEGAGFMFGNGDDNMFFCPCYSWQNGYYSSNVDIYYDGELVIDTLEAKTILYM